MNANTTVRATPRVLYAEDDPLIARIATGSLTRLGFDVVHVATGIDALQRLNNEAFDLVIVDLGLPILDGLGVARWLRAREQAGRAPTPIFVASAATPDDASCKELAIDAVLSKPFDATAFLRAFKAVFARAQ